MWQMAAVLWNAYCDVCDKYLMIRTAVKVNVVESTFSNVTIWPPVKRKNGTQKYIYPYYK